jgi:lysophospholipid acyltransferase (LPLAT)-like uncharacterized protein
MELKGFRLKERILLWLISFAGIPLVNALSRTYRVETVGLENKEEIEKNEGNIIYAFWHQRFFYFISHFKDTKARILISLSRDGEYIAKAIKGFGYVPIRGSSSRRGFESSKEMLETLKEGYPIGIATDGPRGPARVAKPGIVLLAKHSGVPILPVTVGVKSRWTFKSWDRFIIPKPFTKVCLMFGKPIIIRGDADDVEVEAKRAELEKILSHITAEADRLARAGN